MSNMGGLMRHTKKQLCDMIMTYEDGYDDVQTAIKQLIKENENLKLEAEVSNKSYEDLLKHKKSIMKRYRDELYKNKLEDNKLEPICDLGGNLI